MCMYVHQVAGGGTLVGGFRSVCLKKEAGCIADSVSIILWEPPIERCLCNLKSNLSCGLVGTREIAQCLRALTAHPEMVSLVLCTHIRLLHNSPCNSALGDPTHLDRS